MGLTRLDYDFNPSYPWAGHVANITAVAMLPAGVQEWIVVHTVLDNNTNVWSTAGNLWLVRRRVFGDYRSGAPISNLTLGAVHYTNLTLTASWLATTISPQNLQVFDPSPAAAPTLGHFTVHRNPTTGNGFVDVVYGTVDYDSNALAVINNFTADVTAYYSPYTPGASDVLQAGAWAGNPSNIVVAVGVTNQTAIGSVNPATTAVQTPVVNAGFGLGRYTYFNLGDDRYAYVITTSGSIPFLLDYAAYPCTVQTQTIPPANLSGVGTGATAWYWNLDGNPSLGPAFSGTGCYYVGASPTVAHTIWGFGVSGSQLSSSTSPISGVALADIFATAFWPSTRIGQRRPAGGFPAGMGYTPAIVYDSFAAPTVLSFYTLGHAATDYAPIVVDSYALPSNPLYTPGPPANAWFTGGLALAAGGAGNWLRASYGANYDINGGLPATGSPPHYAPALWLLDTATTGTPQSPLNLWAGA